MSNINFKISRRIRDADGTGVCLTVGMLSSGQPAISTNELMLVLNALKSHEQASNKANDCFTYVFPFALAQGEGFSFRFPFTLAAEEGIAMLG